MAQHEPLSSCQVTAYETSGGARIFRIPIQQFPILWGNVYLVLYEQPGGESYRVLIDTGSGFGDSNNHLECGLQAVSELTGEKIFLSNLTHVLITHGHIDHFGGLAYIRPRTNAQIGVHELDLRNLTNYEERVTVIARRLNEFLGEAGVDNGLQSDLVEMYKVNKSLYRSVKIDFTYEATGMHLGPFEMLHVPGHCAGHVVIRLHDILFSGDHILHDTSPHQSPEHLTLFTGLAHYLQSLEAVQHWATGVRLTFGGHENPVTDLISRVAEIRDVHRKRISSVLELLETPHTIIEVSRNLFGEVHGYNILLALEESGAHIEYLYQRGLLEIHNLSLLESTDGCIPLLYHRLS
jgi:glyoxylase-like metal-dependent hydrolase (beta-lactamase superfamily II)